MADFDPASTDVFDIMATTRSMRRLKPDPVPDELIAKILQAGACAANGGNTQKWRFLVVKDPAIKKAVAAYYKKAFDEVVGPRYATSAPPPGVTWWGVFGGMRIMSPLTTGCEFPPLIDVPLRL